MERNQVRKHINEFLQINNVDSLSEETAFKLKLFLREKYPNKQYGNPYNIDVKWQKILMPPIYGKIERCDIFQPNRVLDKVDFEIDLNMEVMVYDDKYNPLTLDMDNLSNDDLIDIKHITDRYHRIDLYKTFMRIKPVNRGRLSNMINGGLSCFHDDIPPYGLYKYEGKFPHQTNKAIGDLGGGRGFGGFIIEFGTIAEVNAVSIGEHAFDGCLNLTEVFIGKNVKYIGKHAFSNIKNLVIHCKAPSKPNQWDDNWCDENCTVIWGE